MPNRRKTSSRRNLYTRRKLAVIIANENYDRPENKLEKSVAHAQQLGDLLRTMSFNVMVATKIRYGSDIMRKVQELDDICTIEDGDLILFYFSGHGYQLEGKNYLIPTDDSRLCEEKDVKDIGIDAAQILGRLREKRPNCAIIFILDCCRPYALKKPTSGDRK